MTEYLLSVWHEEGLDATMSDKDIQRMFAQVDVFNTKLQAEGKGLRRRADAAVVRHRGQPGR